MNKLQTIILVAAALGAGWVLRELSSSAHSKSSSQNGERKALYYQSAMHPWVKSDAPGRCTICGMELTPVFPGEMGMENTSEDVVVLTQTQIQVLHVETAKAAPQPLSRTLRVAGVIADDARRHRVISAYVDSRIEKLHANQHGIGVVAGEPLAVIYSPVLLQAEREYRQLEGELKRNAALRLQQLGLTPAQISALGSKDGTALTSEILSPMSGTVVFHDVYEGQYVNMGQRLFEIADFSTMWFVFIAYEPDMPWIELGQSVVVTTPSRPGQQFEGQITFIDPNFDDATRSAQIRVELVNPLVNGQRALMHRVYAEGGVKVATPEVLAVPRSSIIQTGPESVVYVDQGGGAYSRSAIKLGRRGDHLVEVLSGLKEGDMVVTNGNLLIDGQAEMNRSLSSDMHPAAPDHPPMASTIPASVVLNDAQRDAIQAFIRLVDAMAVALSADDLAAFVKVSDPAMKETARLKDALGSIEGISENLVKLTAASHFHGFPNIKAARIAFHPFVTTAAALLEPLRKVQGVPAFKLWECGMVNVAVPNAPQTGRWVQLGDRPGHNPFFGAEMLECASEVELP